MTITVRESYILKCWNASKDADQTRAKFEASHDRIDSARRFCQCNKRGALAALHGRLLRGGELIKKKDELGGATKNCCVVTQLASKELKRKSSG